MRQEGIHARQTKLFAVAGGRRQPCLRARPLPSPGVSLPVFFVTRRSTHNAALQPAPQGTVKTSALSDRSCRARSHTHAHRARWERGAGGQAGRRAGRQAGRRACRRRRPLRSAGPFQNPRRKMRRRAIMSADALYVRTQAMRTRLTSAAGGRRGAPSRSPSDQTACGHGGRERVLFRRYLVCRRYQENERNAAFRILQVDLKISSVVKRGDFSGGDSYDQFLTACSSPHPKPPEPRS